MRVFALAVLLSAVLLNLAAAADYRITRDHGGLVDLYKLKYAEVRDRGERVIIDGFCNSACTLVLGIVPLNRICVTSRASFGFHMAYYQPATTEGIKVVSFEGTADIMSYYPEKVKEWLGRHGGLTANTIRVTSGPELWSMVNPCPEGIF